MVTVTFRPSQKKDKKLNAIFSNGKVVSFGAQGYSDYTIHKDPRRKSLYIQRHKRHENWSNLQSPGALSRFVLWEYPDLKKAENIYKLKVIQWHKKV